jgi:hypothetical protein
LASATATTLKGRRARSCVSQGYFPGFCSARRAHYSVQLFQLSRQQHLHPSTDYPETKVDDQTISPRPDN